MGPTSPTSDASPGHGDLSGSPSPDHGSRRCLPGRGQWDCTRSRLPRSPACRCTSSEDGEVGGRELHLARSKKPFPPQLLSPQWARSAWEARLDPWGASPSTTLGGPCSSAETEALKGDWLSGRIPGSDAVGKGLPRSLAPGQAAEVCSMR